MEDPTEIPEVVPRHDAEPRVHNIFEDSTRSWQWIVADADTKSAIIINPVLDEIPRHRGICTTAADQLLEVVRQHGYRVVRILETHTNRQSSTAAWYLRTQLRDAAGQAPRICTGKSIAGVQRMFARQYKIEDPGFSRHFDSEFRDGQIFNFGHLQCQVLQLDTDFAFVVGRHVFLGDVPGETSMKRLAGFTNGYSWHPGDVNSRPARSARKANAALSVCPPRASLSSDTDMDASPPLTPVDKKQSEQRPPSAVHEMQG